MADKLEITHLRLLITVNHDEYAFTKPNAQTELSFSIPVALVNTQSLAKLIEKQIHQTYADFGEVLKEQEEEE
jgi:hypothetical protein